MVGFVFEGRPNVFADATGVLAAGNTVVFRIGSDALDTARAIMDLALAPALAESGLPDGAVVMIDTPSRAAGWAMFSDSRLSLAVARGSGTAVAQLGAVARQSGVPVSLHGTGGAWIVAGSTADAAAFGSAVLNSLDRKVCNSVNAVCIVESRTDLIPVFLDAFDQAGTRLGTVSKLHVTESALAAIPESWMQPAEIFRLDSRSARASAKLAAPISLNYSQPTLLVIILRRLEKEAQVRIVVDWRTLAAEGWNADGEGVLSIQNKPLSAALTGLLAPMDLAWRVVDEQTVQVTTAAANSRTNRASRSMALRVWASLRSTSRRSALAACASRAASSSRFADSCIRAASSSSGTKSRTRSRCASKRRTSSRVAPRRWSTAEARLATTSCSASPFRF